LLVAWRQTDCLIGTEAELATHRSDEGIEGLISGLLCEGATRVVIKRGARGAAFGESGGPTGVLKVDPIAASNTVGAGDSFNAGVIHRLCAGEPLEAAVAFGLQVAGRAVRSGRGAMGALKQ
jgi:sugar/nucleoside kinase (ribokinase family)